MTTIPFSLIIPTYNRPERLQQCLQSIAQLNYPQDQFQVIIVDDGSKIPLDPVVYPFQEQFSLQLIRQSNAGPASARNTGAMAAIGEYLVFTDDDCQVDPDWLKALEQAIAKVPNAMIGGYTVNALRENLYSTASQLLVDYLYNYYNTSSGKATFFTSNNFAVPRLLYQKLGGFNTKFPLAAGEDREFCDRWHSHDFLMHHAPDMRVYHSHTLALGSFWRQHFNYGRGAFHFHKSRSERQAQPIKVEPLRFYIRLLTYPFSQQNHLQAIGLSSLFLLSQIANIFGFFWETRQQKS
jgi:GT2 family glycosyltransferase